MNTLSSIFCLSCLLGTVTSQETISDVVSTNGDGNFNFEVLGSLCFAEGTSADIRFIASGTNVAADAKMLVFTQATLHQLYSDSGNCVDQYEFAEFLTLESGPTQEITINPSSTDVTFSYSSAQTTELFFVLWACNTNDQINVDYSIVSEQASDCTVLRTDLDATGYAVAVVFLCLMDLGLVVMTMIFWKRKEQLAAIEI
jgi:hypothetical protein